MFATKNVIPSAELILRVVARELSAHALEVARDFYMMDPNEYVEFDMLPGEVLGADVVRRTFRASLVEAVVEAKRITAGVNLLREAEKWEDVTGEDAIMFAIRLTRQALGESGGLFTHIFSDYELPDIQFSTFNPWDASSFGDWVIANAMSCV